MLSIINISKSFKQRGIVLDNLCLEVKEGETVAIMGPSGSGKTTLMNIIGLLDKPDSGEITFRGSSIAHFTEDESAGYRNKNIGFVFQEHLLIPYLTVSENVLLPLLAAGHSQEELSLKEQNSKRLMGFKRWTCLVTTSRLRGLAAWRFRSASITSSSTIFRPP